MFSYTCNPDSGDNGPATSASLEYPAGLAVGASGNLYIADFYANRVREVSHGIISTVAGNGTVGFSGDNGLAVNGQLNEPFGITVNPGTIPKSCRRPSTS